MHRFVLPMVLAASMIDACTKFEAAVDPAGGDAGADGAIGQEEGGDPFEGGPADGGPDGRVGRSCDPQDRFAQVVEVEGINDGLAPNGDPTLRADELEIFYQRGDGEIWQARRSKRTDAFDAPRLLDIQGGQPVNSYDPSLSGDGLTLYFAPNAVIHRAHRPGPGARFEPAAPLGLTTKGEQNDPYILPDERALYYAVSNDAGVTMFRAQQSGNSFGVPVPLPSFEFPALHPVVSADELVLYVSNPVTGRVHRAMRPSPMATFSAAMPVPELEPPSGGLARPGWISPDNCRLYLSQGKDLQSRRIYVAERIPR